MEIRARLRGEKNGFNMGIWLISDESGKYNTYTEVDILENPTGPVTGNKAHQTFHTGISGTDKKTQTANHTININEWNSYWFEWRSDSEVALGINGQETVCYKKADCPAGYWTFTDEQNLNGLKFILTTYHIPEDKSGNHYPAVPFAESSGNG